MIFGPEKQILLMNDNKNSVNSKETEYDSTLDSYDYDNIECPERSRLSNHLSDAKKKEIVIDKIDWTAATLMVGVDYYVQNYKKDKLSDTEYNQAIHLAEKFYKYAIGIDDYQKNSSRWRIALPESSWNIINDGLYELWSKEDEDSYWDFLKRNIEVSQHKKARALSDVEKDVPLEIRGKELARYILDEIHHWFGRRVNIEKNERCVVYLDNGHVM